MGLVKWVKDGAKAVGNVAKDGASAFGNVVKDGFDKIGDGADWALDKTGEGINKGLTKVGLGGDVGDWIEKRFDEGGDFLNGVYDGAGKLYQLPFNIVATSPEKIGRFYEGVFSPDLWRDRKGYLERGAWNFVDVTGIPAAVDTLSSIVKPNTRGLTDKEIEIARSVFGDAIDYSSVRIDESSWTKRHFNPSAEAYTLFNTINCKFKLNVHNINDASLLIHELTHVWQYQTFGPAYIDSAIFNAGDYGYGGVDGLKGKHTLTWPRQSGKEGPARGAGLVGVGKRRACFSASIASLAAV